MRKQLKIAICDALEEGNNPDMMHNFKKKCLTCNTNFYSGSKQSYTCLRCHKK